MTIEEFIERMKTESYRDFTVAMCGLLGCNPAILATLTVYVLGIKQKGEATITFTGSGSEIIPIMQEHFDLVPVETLYGWTFHRPSAEDATETGKETEVDKAPPLGDIQLTRWGLRLLNGFDILTADVTGADAVKAANYRERLSVFVLNQKNMGENGPYV